MVRLSSRKYGIGSVCPDSVAQVIAVVLGIGLEVTGLFHTSPEETKIVIQYRKIIDGDGTGGGAFDDLVDVWAKTRVDKLAVW